MAKSVKKRKVKVEAQGQAHIHSSFNNIIISLTNNTGQVIFLVKRRKDGIPWFQEKHALRCAMCG